MANVNSIEIWNGTTLDMNCIIGFTKPHIEYNSYPQSYIVPNNERFPMMFDIITEHRNITITEYIRYDTEATDSYNYKFNYNFKLIDGSITSNLYDENIVDFVDFNKKYNNIVNIWKNKDEY